MTNPIHIRLVLVVLALLFSGASGVYAQSDFQPVRGTAIGASEDEAVREAYYSIFTRALAQVSGNQAVGSIGSGFRRDYDRDFEGFRSRYFMPDTDYRCQEQSNGRYLCEVFGTFNVAALQTDLRSTVRSTEARLSNQLTFVVRMAEADDSRADFLVDQLSGAFARDGHTILAESAAINAIGRGDVDFSLAIYEASFSDYEYDPYAQQLSGGLIIRFHLRHLPSGQDVASVPVSVTNSVRGPSPAALEAELTGELAQAAANEVSRRVTESVITFQHEQGDVEAAQDRVLSGQSLYLLRVSGVGRGDRGRIRTIRDALENFYPGSQPRVDYSESDDTRVTIAFTTGAGIVPDDLIDRLYGQFHAAPDFYAEYHDGNEYEIGF